MSKFDMSRFHGVMPAFCTPFDEKGRVDVDAAAADARFLVNKGVNGLYLTGSSGECMLLSEEERKALSAAVVAEVGKEIPCIVHVAAPSTAEACRLAEHAEKIGAAAIAAVPSCYYVLNEAAIFVHWTEMTKAADLPFFIYNIPGYCQYNLSVGLFRKMLENDRVAGLKNTSTAAFDIMKFRQIAGENFCIMNGPDEQFLAGRVMGANGGIGTTYSIMPELFLALDKAIEEKRMADAEKLQYDISHIIFRVTSCASTIGATKALCNVLGQRYGKSRLPILPCDENDPAILSIAEEVRQRVAEL